MPVADLEAQLETFLEVNVPVNPSVPSDIEHTRNEVIELKIPQQEAQGQRCFTFLT